MDCPDSEHINLRPLVADGIWASAMHGWLVMGINPHALGRKCKNLVGAAVKTVAVVARGSWGGITGGGIPTTR